jgi:hypothetical protein
MLDTKDVESDELTGVKGIVSSTTTSSCLVVIISCCRTISFAI